MSNPGPATTVTSNYLLNGDASDGDQIASATGKVGFYGKVPVVIRPYSSAVHATSAQATSSAYGATQLATMQEVMKTLTGLGIWATV